MIVAPVQPRVLLPTRCPRCGKWRVRTRGRGPRSRREPRARRGIAPYWQSRLAAMQMAGGPQISVDGPVISTDGPVIAKTDDAPCCCEEEFETHDCSGCILGSSITAVYKDVVACVNGTAYCLGNDPAGFDGTIASLAIDMDYLGTDVDPELGDTCHWYGTFHVEPTEDCFFIEDPEWPSLIKSYLDVHDNLDGTFSFDLHAVSLQGSTPVGYEPFFSASLTIDSDDCPDEHVFTSVLTPGCTTFIAFSGTATI